MTAVAALGVSTAAVAAPLLSGQRDAVAQELPVWTAAGHALPAPAEPGRTDEGANVSLDAAGAHVAALPADDLAKLPALDPYSIRSSQTSAPAPAPPDASSPAPSPATPPAQAALGTGVPDVPSTASPSTTTSAAPPATTAPRTTSGERTRDGDTEIDLPEPEPSETSTTRTRTTDPSDAENSDADSDRTETADEPSRTIAPRLRAAAPSEIAPPTSTSPSAAESTKGNKRPETTAATPRPATPPDADRTRTRTPVPSTTGTTKQEPDETTAPRTRTTAPSPDRTSTPRRTATPDAETTKDDRPRTTTPRTTTPRTTTPRPANDVRPLPKPRCTTSDEVSTDVRTGPAGNLIGAEVSGLPDKCNGRKVRLLVDRESGDEVEVSATAEDGKAEFTLPDPIPPGEVADIRLVLH